MIGRFRVRNLMKKLGLMVQRKKRFVLTTESNHALPFGASGQSSIRPEK